MTVDPLSCITRAPAGKRTFAAAPTSAIVLPRRTIVCPVLGALPVPSIIVTLVSATTESLTATKLLTCGVSVAALCADAAAERHRDAIERMRVLFMAAPRDTIIVR